MNGRSRAMVVAIVGAESTGKTTLAQALTADFAAQGLRTVHVGEYLRDFCDLHGRTPRQAEQVSIAREQTLRIAAAARTHDLVFADTTALMIAVYSEHVFGDTSLYAEALLAQAQADITLLTALDLPWQPDGLQRDGPHVRQPVDAKVRSALQQAATPYAVIAGSGVARLAAARAAVAAARRARTEIPARTPGWRHLCARCGDADCERHLFSDLQARS